MSRGIGENAVIAKIRLQEQGSNPAPPDTGYAFLFFKAGGLYMRFDDGTVAGPFGTNVAVGGTLGLTGDLSPSQITANQNDYNPTGLSGAAVLRLSSDASRNITGLTGGADGRILFLHNIGAQNIVLKDEDAASTAANRLALTGDVTLTPDTVVMLQYDATSARWRVVGGTGSGGALSDGDKGDITVSGGGATWMIDNGVVTFAKMQAITDGKLLGASGGTAVEEITIGAGLSLATNTLSSTITQYTDELAQDAVGDILSDAGDIDFTYDDATPAITGAVKSDAITYVKMQNVSAAEKLLGRGAGAGAGDVQEITLGTNLTMSGTTLNAGGTAVDSDAIHDDVTGEIAALTEKTTLHNDDLFLIEDSEAGNAKKKVKKSNVGGGGGAPTDAKYVVAAANGSLSAELVIPGLAGSGDRSGIGGGGTSEEFDGADPLTWSTNPDTFDCNATIPSYYYIVDNDGSAKYGYVAWSPAGAFDARWKLSCGADHAWGNDFGIAAWIGDNTNSNGVALSFEEKTTPAPFHFYLRAYTVSSGSFTQRGSDVLFTGNTIYFRIVRDGSNNFSYYFSDNGLVWKFMATQNFSLTVARRGFRINSVSANNIYIACDWMRANV